MNVPIPDHRYEHFSIFDDLSQELRLVAMCNGKILSKNEEATQFLGDNNQFFQTLHRSEKERAKTFFNQMYDTGERCCLSITHHVYGLRKQILYHGCYHKGYIYLSGKVQLKEEWKNIEELFKSLPCGYVRVNHELEIVENNRMFFEFVFPKLTNPDSSLGFERLRLESLPGACIYETVMEALIKRSSSERVTGDEEEASMRLRAIALYVPQCQEVIGLLFDESSQMKYEHLLAYKQQMESVSHLAAGVAHELRNPLSVIRGFLQLSELTNSFHKYSQTIFGEVDRMNVIIENFLSISRKRFEIQAQNPMGVIRSVEDIIRSECLLNDVHFEASLSETNRTIQMNDTMIKQVILNLLRNSMEAYPEGMSYKLFSLITKEFEKDYEITVKDNGEGIPEEILDKLGEPFTTTKEKGTGIGISLSKKIIEDHGGSFRIESEKGKGTATIMTLPFED
ncbi:signal transduction histidine kinase [Geomicrobium halophilum]|uniref:histidine kinase n=1 Tax=Geomicrobium halophilum TaxID=549000 RepID=A0A841PXU6_9BACL|nr:ATP-binding protein [Geomicrobium halophilum]MBB6448855.1 signal transduction histidine kinase [Geomicrobium halophilum]